MFKQFVVSLIILLFNVLLIQAQEILTIPKVQYVIDNTRPLAATNIRIVNNEGKAVVTFEAHNNTEYYVDSFKAVSVIGDNELIPLGASAWCQIATIAPGGKVTLTHELQRPIESDSSFMLILHPVLELKEIEDRNSLEAQQIREPPCNWASCEPCSSIAISTCGAGNVKKVICKQTKCECDFECFDKKKQPTETGGLTPPLNFRLADIIFPRTPLDELIERRGLFIHPENRFRNLTPQRVPMFE
jgi:hypothetical protein